MLAVNGMNMTVSLSRLRARGRRSLANIDELEQ